MGDYMHPSATCKVKFEHTKASMTKYTTCDNSNTISVNLYFEHWREIHKKRDCPCRGNSNSILRHKDMDSGVFCATLTFEINYRTINFEVLTANTKQGLPCYMTPGVWTHVKEDLLSYILNYINFDTTSSSNHNNGYSLDYEMFVIVDVSTIYVVDDNGCLLQ